MNDLKQNINEKIARIKAAISLEPHDRVPLVALANFWPVAYSKRCTMQEAFYDIDKAAECYDDAFSRWNHWDAFDTRLYSLGPMLDAVGSRRYNIPGKDISPQAEYQHPDLMLMSADEYPELIKDPVKFQHDKILPRLCTKLDSDDFPEKAKALAKAALYYGILKEKSGRYRSIWLNEYGIPPLFEGGSIYLPLDWIADKLRGFHNGLIDIKEHCEKLQEACDALAPITLNMGVPPTASADDYQLLFNPQHVSPFISPKDYEKVYWPAFKRQLIEQVILERGFKVWIFFEGNQEQHLERLQELPGGMVVAHFEATDLAKAKKFLGGKICIAGGMPARLLAKGSPQEVRERTISVLKLFQDEPGFIMTCDTPLPSNAKSENIQAWLDTVEEYGKLDDLCLSGSKVKEISNDSHKVVTDKGSVFEGNDYQQKNNSDWDKIKHEFGNIKGDEHVIKETWEELEMSFVSFLHWLIK